MLLSSGLEKPCKTGGAWLHIVSMFSGTVVIHINDKDAMMDTEKESTRYRKAIDTANSVYESNKLEIEFSQSDIVKWKAHDLYTWLHVWNYSWNPITKEWE